MLANGDEKAFSSLFDEYFGRLYGFCLTNLRNATEAEDIAQDTFMKIWENRQRIDPENPFGTYLIAIAKNRIYDYIKKKIVIEKHRDIIKSLNWHTFYNDDKGLWDELFCTMLAAIEQLPQARREIMLLRMHGVSNGEIAERMNISVRTVHNQYSKALATLRSLVPPHISFSLFLVFLQKM